MVNPVLGPIGALTATFSNDPAIAESIENRTNLVDGGGYFYYSYFPLAIFRRKKLWIAWEKFFMKHGVWFYAIVSILLSIIVWYGMKIDPVLGFAAVVGSTGFSSLMASNKTPNRQRKNL